MKILKSENWVFSKNNKPEDTAKPGEVVVFKTEDCFAGQIKSEDQQREYLDLNHANPTAGPLYVEGAEPGDTLVVDILDIAVTGDGVSCTFKDEGCLADVSEVRTRIIPIKNGYAQFKDLSWEIDPMIGVIGTCPVDKDISCGYSGKYGGNMDSKLIRKGTRVYLPVYTDGALLQMGDVHATMGDGESCGTGIEVPAEIIVKVDLIKNFPIEWPVTETADYWYINPTGETYGESYSAGAHELVRLMKPVYGWDETDIFIYYSIRGTVEINQFVYPDPDPMVTLRVGVPKEKDRRLMPYNNGK